MRLSLRFSWDSIRSHLDSTCSTCHRSDSWSSCPDKLSSQLVRRPASRFRVIFVATRTEEKHLPADTCRVPRHTPCFLGSSADRPSSTQPETYGTCTGISRIFTVSKILCNLILTFGSGQQAYPPALEWQQVSPDGHEDWPSGQTTSVTVDAST